MSEEQPIIDATIVDEGISPQERATLTEEQEHVAELVRRKVAELQTLALHGSKIGVIVDFRFVTLEPEKGVEYPSIEINRILSHVDFRRSEKS